MRLQYWPLFFSALGLTTADLQDDLDETLTGDDYSFEATYPSGLKLSTEDDPAKRGVLDYEEVTTVTPQIQLKNLTDSDREKRYIACLILWRRPSIIILDEVSWGMPWLATNLTLTSNGTLDFSAGDEGGRTQDTESGEVRNATINVWEQTDEINDYLNREPGLLGDMPVWFDLLYIWRNRSDVPPWKMANLDFKFQNRGGYKRCDVSETGAPIEGVEPGDDESCKKTPQGAEANKDDGSIKTDDDDEGGDGDGDGDGKGDDDGAGSMLAMSWSLASVALCGAVALAAL
ncbi:hypothetical protein LIA77_04042 [Sarocladium implicatum]|nr:hypothetical protein LIA77_04042 [Sarocladium implicatum]